MGAVDYFLKIDGIEGESQDSKHSKEIEIQTWSFGASQGGTMSRGAGGGAGKVAMQDFHFTMFQNKASNKLFLACATGEHIPKATFVARKAGKEAQEYYTIKFEELLISSFQTGGAESGDSLPIEQISFNFTKIILDYKEQNKDGTLAAGSPKGYDLKANKAV